MSVVCLLPARNCAEHVRDYLDSISGLVDAVVALDDGSTDRTAALLEAEPLVKLLLRNPERERYLGWDDGENRNRLLRAVKPLDPTWIFFLDADERIAPDDRHAFKELVALKPERPTAYLLRVFGVAGAGGQTYGPGPWVGRLFTYSTDQVLPAARLHAVTIPTSIPRSHWRRTTVRIQHLGGSTDRQRLDRYRKYQEVDPERKYQTSYEHLLKPRGPARSWPARLPALPAVLNGTHVAQTPHDGPMLSAVIISRDDGPRIEPTVAFAVGQECPFPFEVIVVVSGSGGTADFVRERFPEASVVQLDRPALPGEARNAGLRLAQGRYVTFIGSHVVAEPGAFASRVRAHECGYAMVSGTMLNGTRTPAGWATYFLDNSGDLPDRPGGPLGMPPVRCSYLREALECGGGFPEDMRAGEDTVVNRRLFVLGYGAFRDPGVVLRHYSRCHTTRALIKHHFQRGRGLGRIILDDPYLDEAVRPLIGFLIHYPATRVRGVTRDVRRWGPQLMWRLRLVLPLVWVATVSAWAGIWYELARAARQLIRRRFAPGSVTAPSRS